MLKEYEYDNKWKKIFYYQNIENKKMGIILTQRTLIDLKDVIEMKKQIRKDGKIFEVPEKIPTVLILIYKILKNLFKKK